MDTAKGNDGPGNAREAAGRTSAPDPLHGPDPLETRLDTGEHPGVDEPIDVVEWSRFIPPIMARIPEVRIGKRWFSILWLLPITVVGLVVGIAVAQQLRTYPEVQQFIKTY